MYCSQDFLQAIWTYCRRCKTSSQTCHPDPPTMPITPVRKHLHWLPVWGGVMYKVLLYAHKVMDGLAPVYLQNLLVPRSGHSGGFLSPTSHRSWQPQWSKNVVCKGFFFFFFCISAPQLWNELPFNTRATSFIESFETKLKTHLLRQSYQS